MKMLKSFVLIGTSLLFVFVVIHNGLFAEEKPIHEGYPFVFDETGTLERMSSKEIVIGDTLYMLSSGTTFHAYDLVFPKASDFSKGDQLGIILNDKKRDTVASVWLIKRKG